MSCGVSGVGCRFPFYVFPRGNDSQSGKTGPENLSLDGNTVALVHSYLRVPDSG